MEMEGLSLQVEEELEALASIYGEDLQWFDQSEANACFAVKLAPDSDVSIQFTLPPGYPIAEPPHFTLIAPYLRGGPRKKSDDSLQAVAERSLGQCCLYQLIEKARELLADPDIIQCVPAQDLKQCAALETTSSRQLDSNEGMKGTPTIIHGEPFTERKSTFQAHMARVRNLAEVSAVMKKLKSTRKIAEATHNIVAYRITGAGEIIISDCDDDGETNAGSRLLHLLNILNVDNVVVVVSRWFGGILLGPERFKHICNAARDLLSANSAINRRP